MSENEVKNCPFFGIDPEKIHRSCQREKCAWWDEIMRMCAVLVIAKRLVGLFK